jgi:hypothetical protein
LREREREEGYSGEKRDERMSEKDRDERERASAIGRTLRRPPIE